MQMKILNAWGPRESGGLVCVRSSHRGLAECHSWMPVKYSAAHKWLVQFYAFYWSRRACRFGMCNRPLCAKWYPHPSADGEPGHKKKNCSDEQRVQCMVNRFYSGRFPAGCIRPIPVLLYLNLNRFRPKQCSTNGVWWTRIRTHCSGLQSLSDRLRLGCASTQAV